MILRHTEQLARARCLATMSLHRGLAGRRGRRRGGADGCGVRLGRHMRRRLRPDVYDVELTVGAEVEHPLVEDDVVVEGLDPERMAALGHFDRRLLQCLAAQHVQLPLLGAVGLFQRDDDGRLVVNGQLIAQVATVLRLGGNHGGVEHGLACLLGLEVVGQFATLGKGDGVHGVAEHLDGVRRERGLRWM